MKIILLVLMGLSFLSCESDPYPTDDNLTKNRRPTNSERRVANSLHVSSKYSLKETKKFELKIKFTVPEGEKEVIEVEGLPSGAVFDKTTYTISWTPSMFAANDPTDPRINQQDYEVKVRLFTLGEDPRKGITQNVSLEVHDVPQVFDIIAKDKITVVEGSLLEYKFEIQNLDYPQGPFDITLEGMPANSTLTKIDEKNFKVSFSPDFHHVKNNSNLSYCSSWRGCAIDYKGKIIIANPANHRTEKEVKIEVKDKRQEVTLVTPLDMEQGLDISFQVTAFDPNGEVAPHLEFDGKRPGDGAFTTSLVKNREHFSSVLSINWKDVPPSYDGRSFVFPFKACVLKVGSSQVKTNCETSDFTVKIKIKERKAPQFSRRGWLAGEIKYLNYKEEKSYGIEIRDGDNISKTIQKIEIVPSSMAEYVEFSNERLTVNFDKAGIHQFSIVATSEYGMATAQSFVAEVFKETRSKTIYFTNTHKDPEAVFFKKHMKNVEMLNPFFQNMNKRMLSGRDHLILGTNILQDTEFIDIIETAMGSIKNIIIASPMLENMPQTFLDELHGVYKVAIDGRFNEISKTPLEEMLFISRSDFEDSSDVIGLKQTTTSESANPLIFSIGVDRQDCQDVLDLTDKKKTLRYKMGIICDRSTGGRYAILGTEFSDFKTSETDKDIPAKWLMRMLNTKLNDKTRKEGL